MVDEETSPIRHVEVPSPLRSVKKRIPSPLKNAARAGFRKYGRATAQHRVLPTFLIIGTKRGGTTSLMDWLLQHPGVLPMFPASQEIKSPHYFDINYWRGLDWYRSHFATRGTFERAGERLGYPPATGECSPYYMFHPAAPWRVAETVPEVRLIVLLRDPVRRAYSNYWERRGSNAEELESFERAIQAEPHRLAGEHERLLRDPGYHSLHHDWHSYLARGRYLEHLGPWLRTFPREQLFVLRSEDLYEVPQRTLARVQRFLGLAEMMPNRLSHHNKLPVAPMSAETAAMLAAYYRPHNARLYEELGIDMRWEETYQD